MGQAFDRDGHVLGEAFGDTKREVFDKLNEQFKNAHEIRIKSLLDKCRAVHGSLCCDREQGHSGQHRGYDGQIDEPLFWGS